MSAIDLQTLRATVRFRGDYQSVRKFPDADVDKEIQSAFGEFYELVVEAHEGWFDTDATVSTVASQAFAALPEGTWIVRGVDLLDGSEYCALRRIGPAARNRYGSDTGQPQAYRLTARGADLYPTPDAAYTLRVTYTPRAPELAEAQPREWYNGWEEYVIEATLLRLDRREQRPLGDRMATLEKLEKRIRRAASERNENEPELLPILGESGDIISLADRGIFT